MAARAARSPIITLTTDFGTRDGYAAQMRAVILTLHPEAEVVDISHGIRPQGIVEGGYVLAAAFPVFPAGTIHVLVVDPGVGTSRRILLARTENHIFLAPDNGSLGPAFDVEPPREVVSVTAAHHFRKGIGATFQGRDVMAPVAAKLAKGLAPSHFGEPVTEWVPSPLPAPERRPDGKIALRVARVDRFGNLICNAREDTLARLRAGGDPGTVALEIGGRRIEGLVRTYAEGPPGGPFALFNSAGYLEVAVAGGSAAEFLSVRDGDPVLLSG
jgi:hypothetical protein